MDHQMRGSINTDLNDDSKYFCQSILFHGKYILSNSFNHDFDEIMIYIYKSGCIG